jgi:uncharacterized protein YlxP (DUF503 family)
MHASLLRLELRLDGCRDGAQWRRRVDAIIEKLRRHFNVSVTAVERAGHPDLAALGVTAVGRGRREAREPLEHVLDALTALPHAELVGEPVIRDF